MSYGESRKRQSESDINHSDLDFSWEAEQCPLLHSGFLECLKGDGAKSVLKLSIWFTQGHYSVLLLDRERKEKCFVNVGTLSNCFQIIEDGLMNCNLEWTPYSENQYR